MPVNVQEILVRSVKDDDEDGKNKKLRLRICPKCGGKVKLRQGAFFLQATGPMVGLVCDSNPEMCSSVWEDPDNRFLEAHVREIRARGSN